MPMADPVDREVGSMDPLRPRAVARELPERATDSELGHIPVAPSSNPRLNSAAETVGSALGTAVSSVRHLPSSLQEAKSRFTVIRGRKKSDVKEAADEAIERIREAGAEVKEQAREGLEQARHGLEHAQARAERLAHTYPLHVMAGAAAFGLLLGIGLRIWRDHAS